MFTPRTRRIAATLLLTAALTATGCTATATVSVDPSKAATASESTEADSGATTELGRDLASPVQPLDLANGCRFTEIDDFGDIQIEIAFASAIDVQDDVFVFYVLFDGTGAVITSSSTLVEDLLPGERVRMAVDTVETMPTDPAARNGITCQLVEMTPVGFETELFRAQPSDSCRFIELDFADDIQIEIDLTNPLAVAGDLVIDFALRGPDGTRFGDGLVFTETLEPGERIVQESDTFTDLPDWVPESTVSCEILSIQDF